MLPRVFLFAKSIGFINFVIFALYLTNPFDMGFVLGYFLIISIALHIKFIRVNLDLNFFLLFLFSLVYGIFYSFKPVAGMQYAVVYAATPPFLYLWGKYLTQKSSSTEKIFYLILGIGFIFSVAGLISVLLDISKGGFVQANRNVPMFWSDVKKNATGMAALFTFNMCIPAILLSSFKKLNTFLKIGLVLVFLLSFACILRLGSRTQLVITLFTFLIGILYVMPRQSAKQNMGLFALLGLGVFFVFRNVSFDLDSDWLTSFAGRMENNGAEDVASGGGRTQRWVKSFEYIYRKPLGWDVKEFGFSHNLWFDVLRAGSIISFVLLIIITARSFFQTKMAIKKDSKNTSLNVLLISYYVAFMLLFTVEPIIDGSFTIFVVFCVFMGIINEYKNRTTILV